MSCRVEVTIQAPATRIWQLLTDADGFPRWNSTITRIEGRIQSGERLRLHVPGTTRAFTPTVSDVMPDERMTWAGGVAPLFRGVRTFRLTPGPDGSTDFAMGERFSGLMLPLARGSMPDFGPVFERFASDLKREAERSA
ncbi:MAG: SRPBCC family protein [Gemmatimonadales bacterium]